MIRIFGKNCQPCPPVTHMGHSLPSPMTLLSPLIPDPSVKHDPLIYNDLPAWLYISQEAKAGGRGWKAKEETSTWTYVCPSWTYMCPGWTYVCPFQQS